MKIHFEHISQLETEINELLKNVLLIYSYIFATWLVIILLMYRFDLKILILSCVMGDMSLASCFFIPFNSIKKAVSNSFFSEEVC